MDSVHLKMDVGDLLAMPEKLQKAYVMAGKRTIKRTLSWGRTHVVRAVAQASGVKQAALRKSKRIEQHVSRGGASGTLWVGLSPVTSGYLGQARQLKRGAKVKGRFTAGAFVATMPGASASSIFVRRDTDQHRQMRSRSLNAWGITTLPIRHITYPLSGAVAAVERFAPELAEHLQTTFTSELNYRLNVAGAGK